MRSRVLAPLAAAVVLGATGLAVAADPPREVDVIVELEAPPALAAGGTQRLASDRAEVRDAVRSAGLHLRERHAFSLTVNALAVTVREDERDELAKLPGVVAVHDDVTARASLGTSVPHVRAPEVWERTGATGEGVDVAVIDTGVDGTHPALEGRVVAGADFVEDDGDPMDDNGHGTHVAGIAAAGGEPTGVAPDATIVAYKVLNRAGSGPISDVIAGIEAAVDPENPHRAEVVNLSLGAPDPMDGPLTTAAQTAAEAGVVVVAAAGNSGSGQGTIGAPAHAPGVLAVGATITDFTVPSVRMTAPRAEDLRAVRWEPSANPPQEERELELVDIGSGGLEGHDVSGKAVLVDAGGPPVDLALEAERRGAVLLIINSGGRRAAHEFSTGSGDDGRFDSLVGVLVDRDATAALREGGPVRVGLSGEDATDQVPAFSSRGPTAGFTLKPDVAAPGVEIRSTVPRALHAPGVARLSGTSMAAPHAAGAAALLRQLHPEWTADMVRAALAGTAEPLDTAPTTSGAGRLDVAAAAEASVLADTTGLSFGLAGTEGRIDRTRSFGLTNHGDEPAVVRLTARSPVRATPTSFTLAPGERRAVSVRLDAAAPSVATELEGQIDIDVRGPAADLRVPWAVSTRALYVAVMPDPTDGPSEAFVATPVELGAAPVVEVRSPDGVVTRVTATHDHDQWYRAPIAGSEEGVYRVRAFAPAALGGAQLSAESTFEVVRPSGDGGWQPVGPNSHSGELDLGPGRRTYVLDTSTPVMWASADRAKTWRSRRITPVPYGQPVELAPDPGRARRLFLAINGDVGSPTFEGKVLRSDDDGRSWTSLPAPNVDTVDLEVERGGEVLALATADGLHASDDGGANWEPVAGPWTSITATHLLDEDLYVGTNQGLFVVDRFSRGGRAARRIGEAGSQRIGDVVGDGSLIAASSFSRVYGSRDGGRTWQALFSTPDGGSIQMLQVADGTAYAATFAALWLGEDRGSRWVQRSEPLPNVFATDVAPHPSGRGFLYSQSTGGLFWSVDGGRRYERVGVQGVGVWDLTVAESRSGAPHLVAGTRWGAYRTPVPRQARVDTEWGMSGEEGAFGQDTTSVVAAPSRPRIVYRTMETAFLTAFKIQRSDDGGQTWRELGEGPETASALHVDPHDWDRAVVGFSALTGNGLLLTEDGGASWRRVRRDSPPRAIVADQRDGDRLWIADAEGLHRSLDGGRTWTRVNDEPLAALALDPEDPDRLLAGSTRLFVSSDGGETLRPAFYADLRLEVSDLLADPHRPGVAYAATECPFTGGLPLTGRGVLRTVDGGHTWSSFSEGLDGRCIRTLELSPDGRYLFAGAAAQGVHRVRLTGRQ